ncbi:MAG TPA: hypothetical protein VFO67_13765 [Gemmatimonadales bacterium]|nr:hypothetical protein [Gemmatimonadales bacterium]
MPIEDTASLEAEFLRLLPLIERISRFVASRYGLFGAEAEDFASHVKERLIRDDYGVLRKFAHRCRIETYLTTVIGNLGKDFKISASGKWRPSAAARRLGQVALLVERLTVCDGRTLDDAWETIRTNYRLPVSRAEVERLAHQLPPRSVRRFVSDLTLVDTPDPGTAPDDVIAGEQRRAKLERALAVLRALVSELPAQDQLILSLCSDGLTVAEIASTLSLDQKRLYRRRDSLFARLRAALEAEAVDPWVIEWPTNG